MPDPLELQHELAATLDLVTTAARQFLEQLDDAPVRDAAADDVVNAFAGSLPESGDGAAAALAELLDALPSVTRSAGPRFFHFVVGGSTAAALGADWLTSVFDQNNGLWIASP